MNALLSIGYVECTQERHTFLVSSQISEPDPSVRCLCGRTERSRWIWAIAKKGEVCVHGRQQTDPCPGCTERQRSAKISPEEQASGAVTEKRWVLERRPAKV